MKIFVKAEVKKALSMEKSTAQMLDQLGMKNSSFTLEQRLQTFFLGKYETWAEEKRYNEKTAEMLPVASIMNKPVPFPDLRK
jgi:hypothetical protein